MCEYILLAVLPPSTCIMVTKAMLSESCGRFLESRTDYPDTRQCRQRNTRMADMESAKVYKEEVTKKGAMKIEVVLEEAKKKKRPSSARTRPGSATSVRSMEDIEKLQQVS